MYLRLASHIFTPREFLFSTLTRTSGGEPEDACIKFIVRYVIAEAVKDLLHPCNVTAIGMRETLKILAWHNITQASFNRVE